ncbi:MAG: hypothetical protein ACOC1K_07255 [Nanoarchaeota archaeon]
MKKIEILNGCTSSITRIDGVDINDIPLDELITKVKTLVETSPMSTLKDVIYPLLEDNKAYKLVDEYDGQCDQCGDYNWDRIFMKK